MTEREAIAHALLSEITGFGHRVGERARLQCADAMIAALGAAGYVITQKPIGAELLREVFADGEQR